MKEREGFEGWEKGIHPGEGERTFEDRVERRVV